MNYYSEVKYIQVKEVTILKDYVEVFDSKGESYNIWCADDKSIDEGDKLKIGKKLNDKWELTN